MFLLGGVDISLFVEQNREISVATCERVVARDRFPICGLGLIKLASVLEPVPVVREDRRICGLLLEGDTADGIRPDDWADAFRQAI
jgi:hypothetical protein